ncbi:MAG: ABC transporter permease [Chthonomonadales bacterium]
MSQPNPEPVTNTDGSNASPVKATRSNRNILHNLFSSREFSVVLVLMVLCFGMALAGPDIRSRFFGSQNLHNVMLQIALLGIFAIGETLVIITGGIDLSLGSLIAFTGMIMALFVNKFSAAPGTAFGLLLALLLTLVVAMLIGSLHATLVHKIRLPPFVVTLASLLILRSQSLLVHNQLPISIAEYPAIVYLANGALFKDTWYAIPIPVIILAVIAVAVSIALNKLRVGRYLYSLGSNEQATLLSGVNVYKVKLFAYGVSAILGGIAGILWASYGNQGDPGAASAYELDAVAAAVVGGANLAGGQGSVAGTILGAALLHFIFSAINLTLPNPDQWRGTIVGGVLLFAVLVTALQQRRRTAH